MYIYENVRRIFLIAQIHLLVIIKKNPMSGIAVIRVLIGFLAFFDAITKRTCVKRN